MNHMTVLVRRLPFSLDPSTAEARRRARRRRVLVAAAVVAVTAGGAGAAIVATSSPAVATGPRPIQAAIGASFFGAPVQPGQARVDAPRIYSPRFGVPVVVGNGSREPVILESVRVALSAHFPVAQIGARFTPWSRARDCWGAGLGSVCATRPIAAERPAPLRLAPGHEVLVQLNIRLLTCTRRQTHEPVSVQEITAVYRLPDGTPIQQHPTAISGYSSPFLRPDSVPANLVAGPVAVIMTRPCHH